MSPVEGDLSPQTHTRCCMISLLIYSLNLVIFALLFADFSGLQHGWLAHVAGCHRKTRKNCSAGGHLLCNGPFRHSVQLSTNRGGSMSYQCVNAESAFRLFFFLDVPLLIFIYLFILIKPLLLTLCYLNRSFSKTVGTSVLFSMCDLFTF